MHASRIREARAELARISDDVDRAESAYDGESWSDQGDLGELVQNLKDSHKVGI